MTRPASTLGYGTREVARLLEISEGRVRSWVRAGFLEPRRGPRGEFRFSFPDLVILRAARDLVASRVPARRLRRSLGELRRQLPAGRSLAAVRISARGGEVVVRDGGESWEPASGQRVLDFEVSELAQKAAPLALRALDEARARPDAMDAEDWFALAFELEATEAGQAEEAYRRALELAPGHADAHLNLGRLLHEAGDVRAAERHFARAAALRPDDPIARFNQAVVFQDLGRRREAIREYRRAIELAPDFADAHFNLAGIYQQLGRRQAALRSLKAYRDLIRGG